MDTDFLGSYLRSRVLPTMPEREVTGDLITEGLDLDDKDVKRKYVLDDERNPLIEWQDLEALHHWKLMREVLPDVYWETY